MQLDKKDYKFERKITESWPLIRRLLSSFRPYLLRTVFGMISMGIVAACTAALPFMVKPALDDIFINRDHEALVWVPIFYLVIIAVKSIFQFLQNYLMKGAGLRVLEDIRNELYERIIRLPLKFFDQHQVGMLMSRIINDVLMMRNSLPSFVMSVRQVLAMIALVGVAFYRDWFLASFAVLVLPLAVFPLFYFGRKLRKLGRRNQHKLADIATFLQEIFSGIRVVKAFANEEKETDRFRKENARLVNIAEKEVIHSELSSRAMEIVGALGTAVVIWYGGNEVIAGRSTPGTFFSFITALIMLYDPLKKFNTANIDIQRALAGAERVFGIIDDPEAKPEMSGRIPFVPPFEELRFENVTMQYEGCPTPALSNISLTVRAGERLAVVGPSGGGKSTLVNLIPRFHEPSSGSVYLNGKPLTDYELGSIRRNIGLVSQDAFLFNVSVTENIAYGQASVDEAAIESAARAAFAHDFITELPEGYATVIGERGTRLSGGQKQRLTIARALLKNPPLLILDEATSALDSESEHVVQLALDNLMRERTSIVIAHRLSTVLNADRILVMEKGRIAAQGRHEELLETSDLYARLYAMQFRPESEDTDHTVDPACQASL